MTRHARPALLPVPLLLLNGIGLMMMTIGVVGLTAPEAVSALARPAIAYALIGAGLMLDIAAVVAIMKATTKSRRGSQIA